MINFEINKLDTPALLVREEILQKNITNMQSLSDKHSVNLRPMVKTHKSPGIALKQIEAGSTGILTATLNEALIFSSYGIRDITLAYPVFGLKVKKLEHLARQVSLTVTVDSMESFSELSSNINPDVSLKVIIKINSGLGRLGVEPDDKSLLFKLVDKIISAPNLYFEGVSTHAGHVYKCQEPNQVKEVARQEVESVIGAREILAEKVAVPTVAIGSTPTVKALEDIDGITEIRPGNYVFHDMIQVALGSAGTGECALTVLSTVLSRPGKNKIVIDAGSKALGLDKGPHGSELLAGYGLIVGHKNCRVMALSEELGTVEVSDETGLRPGDKIEVIPNHSCSTANLFKEILVIKGDEIWGKYKIEAR